MVQNCSNVEDVFLIFNVMKRVMLMVICCLHQHIGWFFVAWEAKLKLILFQKIQDLVILWVPSGSVYSMILRTSELSVSLYTIFSHFVSLCIVCVFYIAWLYFKEKFCWNLTFYCLQIYSSSRIRFYELLGAAETLSLFPSKGSDQCPWENLPAVCSSIPAWLLAGCLCPCDSVAGGNVSGHQLITLTVWHISMSCHWGLC